MILTVVSKDNKLVFLRIKLFRVSFWDYGFLLIRYVSIDTIIMFLDAQIITALASCNPFLLAPLPFYNDPH